MSKNKINEFLMKFLIPEVLNNVNDFIMTNVEIKDAIEQNLPKYEECPISEDDLYNKVHEKFETLGHSSFGYILNGMLSKGLVKSVPFQRDGGPRYTKPGKSMLPPNQNSNLKKLTKK